MKLAKRQIKFFVAIMFVAAIIFLNSRNYLGPLGKSFSFLSRYPESAVSKISFSAGNILQFVFEIRKLHEDKISLIEENNRLRKKISDLSEADNENKALRSALNLPLAKEHSLVDGAVIGKDPYSFSNYLLINRGSEANIAADMDVIDASGFYIGKISEAYYYSAKVRLITDSQSVISAVDQNTRVRGLVKNDRNIGLYFDMVSQDDKIAVDDIIITLPAPGSVAVQPIAKVISVEKYPNKPFQKINLLPLGDMKKIEKVFVLMN